MFPFISLHFLCTHFRQLVHCIELLPTPLPHRPHDSLAAFALASDVLRFYTYHSLGFIHIYSHTSILHIILPFIKPLNSILLSLSYHNQVIGIQQLLGKAILNSRDMASMAITNNSGLNAEPWCMPTFTSKPLLLP